MSSQASGAALGDPGGVAMGPAGADADLSCYCARISFASRTAEARDQTGDLQIFSLTLSQLSYRG